MNLQHALPHQLKTALDAGWPLLVPSGCIEYHGPHLPLGVDTLIVDELCQRVAGRVKAVVAPPFWYGPTGYTVTGPEGGTVDVSTVRFGRHVKDVLASFWDIGFKWIIVCQHHQQLDGPEALAIRQAAAEVTFEKTHADAATPGGARRRSRSVTTCSSASRSGRQSCRWLRSEQASSWPITPAFTRQL